MAWHSPSERVRFVPTSFHGFADYLISLLLIALGAWAGFGQGTGPGGWLPVVAGVVVLGTSLCTDYELGVWRLVPVPANLLVDGIAGAALALSPFALGFADRFLVPHLVGGLALIALALFTQTEARPRLTRASPG